MKVTSTIPQSYFELRRPESSQKFHNGLAGRADNALNQNEQNTTDQRVNKIPPSNTLIQKLESNSQPSDSFTRSPSNQPPVQQYQINQQLIQREEIGNLLGIDLFA
ncbi:hypothetical protein [Aliikangiella sp. IMCC44359]|uniref:hypothetical protein n=1 Tax=Aliikangiella sp. IMCC44359 TaxID=3459125 RepID=UPI00403B2DFC